MQTTRKNKAALIWESEPGEVRTYTYQQLWKGQKLANVLKNLGVRKGDRVAIYMGMTPELPIATLACARIVRGDRETKGAGRSLNSFSRARPVSVRSALVRRRLDRLVLFAHLLQKAFHRYLKLVSEQINQCVISCRDLSCGDRERS